MTLPARRLLLALAVLCFVLCSAACSEPFAPFRPIPGPGPGGPPVFADAGRPPAAGGEVVELGRMLFFDRELSGNRNISCATCHVPFLSTAEDLPLSMGEGADDTVPRVGLLDGAILPRHTQDLFGLVEERSFFWDGRVQMRFGQVERDGPVPPGVWTPASLASVVPILDRAEMRGRVDDLAVDGRANELGALGDDDDLAVFDALVARLVDIPEYLVLFDAAYGEPPSIALVGDALRVFQVELWSAPPDILFLDGRLTDEDARRGRELFNGAAGCARCHGIDGLQPDGAFHNLAVPLIGPGFDDDPIDRGRFRVTGDVNDAFAFRTPGLQNVRLTPPYFHNGAYDSLDDVVRHHLDPAGMLADYDGAPLPATLRERFLRPADEQREVLDAWVAAGARSSPELTESEIVQVVAFLRRLNETVELSKDADAGVPESVPSGLPVDVWTGDEHPHR